VRNLIRMDIYIKNFVCKPSNGRYNLTFMKEVHKRNGDTANEPGETLYGIDFDTVKNKMAHHLTIINFGEQNISLKEYLQEFYKNYNEICKSLKKTL